MIKDELVNFSIEPKGYDIILFFSPLKNIYNITKDVLNCLGINSNSCRDGVNLFKISGKKSVL